MGSGRDLTSEQRNLILRLALAGVPIKAVAERMGISEASVRKHYPLQGAKKRYPQAGHKRDELKADLE